MDDARCPARDLNGFPCVLDVDHPGGHTASRKVAAWVDEAGSRLEVEGASHKPVEADPPALVTWDCPRCRGRNADGLTHCAACGTRRPIDGRRVAALGVGILCLLLVIAIFANAPSSTTSRGVYAMSVGAVALLLWPVATLLGAWGVAGLARQLDDAAQFEGLGVVRRRADAGLWVTVAVVGWVLASCAVPLAI